MTDEPKKRWIPVLVRSNDGRLIGLGMGAVSARSAVQQAILCSGAEGYPVHGRSITEIVSHGRLSENEELYVGPVADVIKLLVDPDARHGGHDDTHNTTG